MYRFPEWYDVPDTVAKDSITSIGVRTVEKSHENAENYAIYYEELIENYVQAIYAPFTDKEISAKNLTIKAKRNLTRY